MNTNALGYVTFSNSLFIFLASRYCSQYFVLIYLPSSLFP